MLRAEPGRLFSANGSIFDFLEERKRSIPAAVAKLPTEELLAASDEELVRGFDARLRLNPPAVKLDEVYRPGDPQEVRVDVSREGFLRNIERPGHAYVSGVRVEVHIPVTGDPTLLYYEPSTTELTNVAGSLEGNEIILRVEVPTDTLNSEAVKSELNQQQARIARHAEWLRADCEGYNAQLGMLLAQAVGKRRAELEKHSDLARALDIPVKRRSDPSPVLEVPVKPTRAVAQPAPPARKPSPQPRVSDEDFAAIVQQLITTRNLVERQPSTFGRLGEEALRDLMLVILNNQFGPAGGETFSGYGKTDILIHGRDHPVFIAENKIWSGAKAFASAIDQLLGYLVWRDTKAAVILFVKQQDVSAVEVRAAEVIEGHSQYESESGQVADSRSFILHHAGDASRKIRLALVVIPIKPRMAS
jgi:hypothetical protein